MINRLGFNSHGLDVASAHLAAFRRGRRPGIVGVNLGKNRDSTDAAGDYVQGVEALAPFADYLTINVSSPNTPGLRSLQGRGQLEALLARVQGALDAAAAAAPAAALAQGRAGPVGRR